MAVLLTSRVLSRSNHKHRLPQCDCTLNRPPCVPALPAGLLCCCSWFYEKALATFSSWGSVRAALLAARPSPWGALVLLMIGSFVKSVVEQFAQVGRG